MLKGELACSLPYIFVGRMPKEGDLVADLLLKDVAAGGGDACASVYCMPDFHKNGDGSALLAHL